MAKLAKFLNRNPAVGLGAAIAIGFGLGSGAFSGIVGGLPRLGGAKAPAKAAATSASGQAAPPPAPADPWA